MSGDSDSDTVAVDTSFLEKVTLCNRQYQRYAVERSVYFEPIDEYEAERLRRQHEVLKVVFDNKLIFPPINNPKKILDCGYGSAQWALEVAEAYPGCKVIGVDISPHMRPDTVPENLWLQMDDLNRTFTFPRDSFDLVHSRLVAGGIDRQRWPSYVRDIVRVLKPGGWVQFVEIYWNCQSDNGLLTDDHALRQWSNKYMNSPLSHKKDLRTHLTLEPNMRAAGLINIQHTKIQLPLTGWSPDQKQFQIGELNRENTSRLLDSMVLWPFLEMLKMNREDLVVLIAHARAEAAHPGLKAYFPLYVYIGQKAGA